MRRQADFASLDVTLVARATMLETGLDQEGRRLGCALTSAERGVNVSLDSRLWERLPGRRVSQAKTVQVSLMEP